MVRSQVLNLADNFAATITAVASPTKPTWMLVAGNDRTINPELERWHASAPKATTSKPPAPATGLYLPSEGSCRLDRGGGTTVRQSLVRPNSRPRIVESIDDAAVERSSKTLKDKFTPWRHPDSLTLLIPSRQFSTRTFLRRVTYSFCCIRQPGRPLAHPQSRDGWSLTTAKTCRT